MREEGNEGLLGACEWWRVVLRGCGDVKGGFLGGRDVVGVGIMEGHKRCLENEGGW